MADFDDFSIDGNLAVFEKLVELLETGEAVGFVGAGASAPLYPLWTGLIETLADEAVTTRKADGRKRDFWCRKASEKPDKIAKQIRDVLDTGVYAGLMRRLFGPKPDGGRRFTDTHARLLGLPFQGFVTTNYDPCLDEACFELRKARKPVPFTWSDDRVELWWREEPADARELPILHAHGRFDDSDSLVLCIDDYRKVYGEAAPYRELLGHLFTRKRLVFVGFGFSDPWVTSFADRVSTLTGIRDALAPPHIAVLGLPEAELADADLHAADLEESLRAEVLFYPVGPGHDHSALMTLLDALTHRVNEPHELNSTSIAATPPQPSDLLDEWLAHVEDEHGRLADCFNRPGRLHLIERGLGGASGPGGPDGTGSRSTVRAHVGRQGFRLARQAFDLGPSPGLDDRRRSVGHGQVAVGRSAGLGQDHDVAPLRAYVGGSP